MKIITNGFKEEIAKLGREIDFKINLHINDKLITQDNQFIVTEDNIKLIVEQINEEEIDETIGAEDIYNATIVSKGSLLSTLMKEFDFEISEELRIGDIVDCSFGLKVGDEYEYVNYGKFIIYSKEFNEDTKTYSYVAYDSMLFTMKEFENSSSYTGALFDVIPRICEQVGLECDDLEELTSTYPNLQNIIDSEIFDGIEMTYRDVLDIICQALGLSMIVEDKTLKLKSLNNTIVDTFDGNYLKDTNVRFNKKYMINSVVLSRSDDNDNIYRRDEESIDENGVHEFKIKDNLILNSEDRELFIDEIFEQLNGVEFYINDFTSTGITYLDWLDYYNIEIDGKIYKCLMLNDEIKIQQGLEESIYTDEPEETVTDYKVASKTDKEVSFIVDKQKGEISAKVSKGDVINQINLDETGAEINANKISLAGKTIEMTSDNISIESTKFSVDKNGYINATGGTIGGFTLGTNEFTANLISEKMARYTYSSADMSRIRDIIMGNITPTAQDYDKYDFDNSGTITTLDWLYVGQIINGTEDGNAVFTLNTKSSEKAIILKKPNGTIKVNLGIFGSYIHTLTTVNLNSNSLNTTDSVTVGDNISLNASTGNITCVSLTQTSKEESKKNFEKYENALEEVKNTNIYKYNLKTEDDNKKKHVGFVIGKDFDYSHDITAIDENNEETGVDTYSMVSVLWQAVKEQQEQIEELKEQIKSLKGDEL